jgi:hypothetical protein
MSVSYLLKAASVSLLAVACCAAQDLVSDTCPDGSPIAFKSIEVTHPIDSSCPAQGKASSPAGTHAQNLAKNNFCATSSNQTPETITPQDLITLQQRADEQNIRAGQGQEPEDRTPLKRLGEGKLVRMAAFLIEAHYADLGSGESVNCDMSKSDGNDIHMAFGATSDTEECGSVTAEISPHFRPASWNVIGQFETFSSTTKKYSVNQAMADRLQEHEYRITGQLFFDASHEPCPCGTTCAPSRASVWEIHPVYAIEICKPGTNCDVSSDSDWIPFDTWWKSLTPLRKHRPPHSHAEVEH